MAAETEHKGGEIAAIRRADGESRTLAASLPRLVLEARRIAANVIHGLHGRRRAGAGESFWQYRRFVSGEPSQSVDWRRSRATIICMSASRNGRPPIRVLALAGSLALDGVCVPAGARQQTRTHVDRDVRTRRAPRRGWRTRRHPRPDESTASRTVIDKMAQAMLHDDAARLSLPPSFVPAALAEIVVLSDFWSPIAEIRRMLVGLSASGAHGTLVQIVDPAEETFPYSGRIEFVEPEGAGVITAGRAESWAVDYVARVALHRDEIRSETDKLDWLFSTHTTNRSAAELLLFLHSGMMVSKGTARTATVKAGRSG